MLSFDRWAVVALNHWVRRLPAFDHLVWQVGNSSLLKGGVALTILWWLWFAPRGETIRARAKLLAALAGGFVALGAGRALALLLPFRLRPVHEPALHLVRPYPVGPDELRSWSSFPSDHVMLFTALAVGMMPVSRRAGLFLLTWTLTVIALPRLYLGLHYPSDVLGGALVGVAIALLLQVPRLRDRLAAPPLRWLERHPASFYACLFLFTYQIATMFVDLRVMIPLVSAALRALHR